MGLSDYNGFSGRMREASLRRVHKLWNEGKVPRPTKCEVCFQTEGAIHGHSEDYSNDEVHLPICITCHLMLHMRWQQPDLWEDYRLAVRSGFRGRPLEQKNALYVIKSIYPEEMYRDDLYPNEVRSATVLDMICPIRFIHPNAPRAAKAPAPAEPRAPAARTSRTNPSVRLQAVSDNTLPYSDYDDYSPVE